MKTTMQHLIEAHAKSGAPGRVVGWWGDARYEVELQYGRKVFKFRTHGMGDDRVTVFPCWSIAGDRQRRQATSTP
jgi:hypothetical protein